MPGSVLAESGRRAKVKRYNMFDTWVLAAPAILEFLSAPARPT
jgi:hypothetical protein